MIQTTSAMQRFSDGIIANPGDMPGVGGPVVEYYGIKAGIAKEVTSPHMLRHSIATHYLNGGMYIRKIQHFLGHESLASTHIYTHLITYDQREERNKLHPQNRIKRKLI